MKQGKSKTMKSIVFWLLTLAAGSLLILACGEELLTSPSATRTPEREGSYFIGVTASPIFATTAPPPPPPPPPADDGDDDDTGEDTGDGFVRFNGILVAVDRACPNCVLTLRSGRAVVPGDARLEQTTSTGGEVPLSFAELNQLLRPGVPLAVKATAGGQQAVAVRVRVEYSIRTTGTVSASSSDLLRDREFTLSTAAISIRFVLAEGAMVQSFAANTRVLVKGHLPASAGDPFVATAVQPDI